MEVTRDLLAPGQGVRTGKRLTACLGLVIHWIGAAQGHASVIRGNFSRSEVGTHYISDWYDGHIIQCVPEDEVCYHVGSSYGYTDLKRKLVGAANPNWYFVGIECCINPATVIPGDYAAAGKYLDLGRPGRAQYEALVAFAADFLTRHGMTEEQLYRHYDITGKACHVWFVKEEGRWARFKRDVAARRKGEMDVTKEEIQAMVEKAVAEELARRDEVLAEREGQVSPWAREAWDRMVAAGIFDGSRPGGALTREQAALVLERMEEGR